MMYNYNPSKLDRLLYRLKTGFKWSWGNATAWLSLMRAKDPFLWHNWFFQDLSSQDNTGYIPYHWVIHYLKLKGWRVINIGGEFPFQIEASLKGVDLYFRSRGQTSLTLSNGYRYILENVSDLVKEEEVLQHLYFLISDIEVE